MRWWRWASHPSPALTAVLVGAAALSLVITALPLSVPDLVIAPFALLVAVAAIAYDGHRSAWVTGAAVAAWLVGMYLVSEDREIGLLILTAPGFLAGTALRLRRRTVESLAERARELEEERERFAELTVRNERARIAAELHDVVGHSLSVMVVQAAAGQRTLLGDPTAGREAFVAIAESARKGREELRGLIDLLGGEDVAVPDLALVRELVERVARTGLEVTCRVEGDTSRIRGRVAELAFSVVREGLTNVLRHSPGAPVRVLVRACGPVLTVEVANDAPRAESQRIVGTELGLRGLRSRVELAGGRLESGPTSDGGWRVGAELPAPPR